jgi:hypothetical protein
VIGLRPMGGNYKTVHQVVKRLGLDTSHWTGQAHLRGKTHTWGIPKQPLSEILVLGSTYSTLYLKKRLVEEGLLPDICSGCRTVEWRGQKLVLELEHNNGDSSDHRIENLCLLCPNCHSQTPTFRGRNKRLKSLQRARINGVG